MKKMSEAEITVTTTGATDDFDRRNQRLTISAKIARLDNLAEAKLVVALLEAKALDGELLSVVNAPGQYSEPYYFLAFSQSRAMLVYLESFSKVMANIQKDCSELADYTEGVVNAALQQKRISTALNKAAVA
jgi:hypothetical protein